MKNLLEYILIHLVDNPEDVTIELREDDSLTTYIIHVNPDDIGRVIGKKGSIINSIRNIAKVRAVKEGVRVRVEIDSQDND